MVRPVKEIDLDISRLEKELERLHEERRESVNRTNANKSGDKKCQS